MAKQQAGELKKILVEGRAEASTLLVWDDPEALDALGWDEAFFSALDEGPIEENLVLVGHRAGAAVDAGWECRPVRAQPDLFAGQTDDSESLARYDGHVYVLGSHFGGKRGPLDPRRAFIARFPVSAARGLAKGEPLPLEIRRIAFKLHRVLNDELRAHGVALLPTGERSREVYIERTRSMGRKQGKHWAPDIHEQDFPINIEGLEFADDGSAWLGLRYPATNEGHPLIARVSGLPQLFGSLHHPLKLESLLVLRSIGSADVPAGVRALERNGAELHVLVGPAGDADRYGTIGADHPNTRRGACEHWCYGVPSRASGELRGERVRAFAPGGLAEGVTRTRSGAFVYAIDSRHHVELRLAPPGL